MNTQRKHSAGTRRLLAFGVLLGILLTAALLGAAVRPAPAAAAPGISTLAGAPGVPGTANGTGTAARFSYARGVCVDTAGNVFVADTNSSTIRKITPAGVVTTFAGQAGVTGALNGTGTAATFNNPEGIARDASNNLYVSDTQNNMIRRITPAGVVTTLTGQLGTLGTGGYSDGTLAQAMFRNPRGITVNTDGTIYLADSGNNAIRKITTGGVVSTLAGGLTVFNNPRDLAWGTSHTILYVADWGNQRIARLVLATGGVTNFAGGHTDGTIGGTVGSANGTGAAARFYNPSGIVGDSTGLLYVTDSGNNTIRTVSSATAAVGTYAGAAGVAGSTDGIFTAARFNDPRGIAVDGANNIYVADRGNSTIRKNVATVYTITASAGANGTITPSGVVGVASGGNSTFTITPNTGFHIVNVLVDGGSQGAIATYTFTNVLANHTISATFAINTYTITPSGGGAQGTITPSTVQTVNYGGSATFTMTPAIGFRVADVVVDGTVHLGSVLTYTFTNVTANHTIAVVWGASSFTITSTVNAASPASSGTIAPLGASVVPAGGSQAYTITPNAGFYVLDAVVDGTTHLGPAVTTYTFTNVLAAHTIDVTFAANPVITPSAGLNGGISPSVATSVAYNGSQLFTFTPSAGYYVADVVIDGTTHLGPAVASYTFTNVIANHTIAVTFAANPVITPTAGANGAISPAVATSVAYNGSQLFTFTPSTGYVVSDVVIDGTTHLGSVTSYTFTNVIANHTIAVTFAVATYTITPSVVGGTGGTISPATAQTVAWNGSQSFFMLPAAGYHVSDVSVDGVSQGAISSYTFSNVIANHTIAVTFSNTWTITPTAGANGTITPGAVQTVTNGGSQAFTIAPTAGYYIADVQADGVSVGAVATYTFTNVTANHTISATFAAIGIAVTAPPAVSGPYNQGFTLPVSWTVNTVLSAGEFSVVVRDSVGAWYGGTLVTANGVSTNYNSSVALNVPLGTGYYVQVWYRPTVGSGAWILYGSGPGTFDVSGVAINVTAPASGSGPYTQGSSLPVAWGVSSTVSVGEFSIVVRDSVGAWYGGTIVPANGASATYSGYNVTLNVLPGAGYYVQVWYRPTVGTGPWVAYGTGPGTFTVN